MFNDDFDRDFKRVSAAAIVLGVFGSLVSLALTVAIIWAIVQLVQHFTG